MAARRFAALVGIVFLLIGVLGFFYNHLFGIFHVDTTHNIIHLVVGVLGIFAASHEGYAYRFAQALGIVFMAMAVLGFFIKDLFGLMHVALAENILHFVVGAIALYLGYVVAEASPQTRSSRM
ncbi:DUF4383 domain-containing protein [Paenibacillus abyssi]|uniref:Membrane protein n=1 Tax=Paenibacillus abyssi TaxID=1340531 RepID=A0A917D2S6_9BACL|nr:DUF4383 domain-containing protein [Paenibacillus abyssi]GGG04711.1 membrane protein [Paenibacillus abyssi]